VTIPPEPVNRPSWWDAPRPRAHRSGWEACTRPLRRWILPGSGGYAIEISDARECVYQLEQPDGGVIVVPGRLCGPWTSANSSARAFFLPFDPDAALDVVAVHLVVAVVGRLCYPSGWQAGPWFAHRARAVVREQLTAFAARDYSIRPV
jgi:hypothetical protein